MSFLKSEIWKSGILDFASKLLNFSFFEGLRPILVVGPDYLDEGKVCLFLTLKVPFSRVDLALYKTIKIRVKWQLKQQWIDNSRCRALFLVDCSNHDYWALAKRVYIPRGQSQFWRNFGWARMPKNIDGLDFAALFSFQ